MEDGKNVHVGFFKSNGCANGQPVYKGPRGGLFRYIVKGAEDSIKNKQYVTEAQIYFI